MFGDVPELTHPEIDVDREISRLGYEIDEIRSTSRTTLFFSSLAALALMFWGESTIGRIETAVAMGAIFVLCGVKDHLYRNDIAQAQNQITNLKLWSRADHFSHARIVRLAHVIDSPPKS